MSLENAGWNTPITEEQKAHSPDDSVKQNETDQAEFDRQQESWQKENDRIKAELLGRINEERLREEVRQELEGKGLFDKDDSGSYIVIIPQMLLGIAQDQKLASLVRSLAREMPEGQEKQAAYELAGEFYSRSIHDEDEYMQRAQQSDFGRERHNGAKTAVDRLWALNDLHRFGLIDDETLESEKAYALRHTE